MNAQHELADMAGERARRAAPTPPLLNYRAERQPAQPSRREQIIAGFWTGCGIWLSAAVAVIIMRIILWILAVIAEIPLPRI